MRKTVLISVGIIIILLVISIWVYLLLFGTPKDTGEVFADLGLPDNNPLPSEPLTIAEPESTVSSELDDQSLRQLTTRPVAGFTSVISSSTRIARFVERGTGHIYEINLDTREESRLGGITIPATIQAVFSPDNSTVAIITQTGYTQEVLVGPVESPATQADFTLLPTGAEQINFKSNQILNYALAHSVGLDIYEFSLASGESVRIESLPFRDVKLFWDLDTITFASRFARQLQGGLYMVTASGIQPKGSVAYGLLAEVVPSAVITSKIIDGRYQSEITFADMDPISFSITYIPEKCSAKYASHATLWCFSSLNNSPEFVESWYQGTTISTDNLWLINSAENEALLVSNLAEESGRVIDAIHPQVVASGLQILFINRIDNTLWLYDLTQ